MSAGFFVFMTNLTIATTVIEDYGEEAVVARTIAAMTWDSLLVLGAPLAAFVAGVSAAGLCRSVVPRWIGVAGVPVVILLLVMPLAWMGFMAFMPWIALLSLTLLWRTWSVHAAPNSRTDAVPQSAR